MLAGYRGRDRTWGTNGTITSGIGAGLFPTGGTLTPDGKLLVFGWFEGPTNYPFALARFDISDNTGVIRGSVFDDADGDGVKDAGEAARANVPVYLHVNNNNSIDAGEPATTSDVFGNYSLSNLAAARSP